MLIYEYTMDGSQAQYAAIDNAIHLVQFIHNKCVRLWMDERRMSKNDLQCSCAVSRVRTRLPLVSTPKPAKSALTVHGLLSVASMTFPTKQIKRVRLLKRTDGYHCRADGNAQARPVKRFWTGDPYSWVAARMSKSPGGKKNSLPFKRGSINHIHFSS